MTERSRRVNYLRTPAQFSFFVTSYLPLFSIIILRQISEHYSFLNWAGLTEVGVRLLITKFGFSLFLSIIACFGIVGYFLTLSNVKAAAGNGIRIKVVDVKNKNAESIGYIATYIVPFLFQGFSTLIECFTVLILLGVMYRIYINSSLLLINPVINVSYGTYEIEYEEATLKRTGLIITKNRYLQEGDEIRLYEIGYKLYFAKDG